MLSFITKLQKGKKYSFNYLVTVIYNNLYNNLSNENNIFNKTENYII